MKKSVLSYSQKFMPHKCTYSAKNVYYLFHTINKTTNLKFIINITTNLKLSMHVNILDMLYIHSIHTMMTKHCAQHMRSNSLL